MYDEYIKDINKNFHKKYGNLLLSDYQVQILNQYNIDVYKFNNTKELIMYLEELLNEQEYEDLELVSQQLSEDYYYSDVNK